MVTHLDSQQLPLLVGHQPILSKDVIEVLQHCSAAHGDMQRKEQHHTHKG